MCSNADADADCTSVSTLSVGFACTSSIFFEYQYSPAIRITAIRDNM
jgi:hypothetical protein